MKKTILLIDDDVPFRKMLRKMLERSGYAVEEAADGADGLNRHRQVSADLVVTDLVMPNMEGIETIRKLRSTDEALPIIAVSGGGVGGADAYLAVARRLGARGTFTKPFDRVRFLTAVADALHTDGAGDAAKH